MFPAAAVLALVSLQVVPPQTIGNDQRAEWLVMASNSGRTDAKSLEFQTWSAFSIVEMPSDVCVPEPSPRVNARCVIDVPAQSSRVLRFTAQFERTGRFSIYVLGGDTFMEIDEAVFGREFAVTTNADSGPGSLREALLDVNRECADMREPCVVTFALDDAAPAIRLRTPLPEITAPSVFVDGQSQTRHNGANVIVDGSGLVFRSSYARATGLIIENSPGNGIETNGGYVSVRYNELRNNALRGVQVNQSLAHVYDNILRDNTRAGGFFWSDRDVWVRRNLVTGNGASGLFFHKAAESRIASYAQDNFIAGNAHAGVGLSMGATGDFAMNTIADNRGLPIDVGLDGETRDMVQGLPGQGGRVGAPILLSARFDGTHTIVSGRISARGGGSGINERVYVYASAQPEIAGEVVAIVLGPVQQRFPDLTFTARIAGDLRGQFVRATAVTTYVYNWDDFASGTSELSAALPVE